MLKKISNLGNALSKKEQTAISGGTFCMIHCLDECLASFGYSSEYNQHCNQHCIDLSGGNGGF